MEDQKRTIALIEDDPWLEPYHQDISDRITRYEKALNIITIHSDSLLNFASAHKWYGLHFHAEHQGWYLREWAPGANAIYLLGDFNQWNPESHPMQRKSNGDWEIFLNYHQYKDTFTHGSNYKIRVVSDMGTMDRIPAYANRVYQQAHNNDFTAQVWNAAPYTWKHENPAPPESLLIYEAHVGIAQETEGVGSYKEFTERILPRIKEAGYTIIQLMAVMEHPYYGSFGYHVSNFFAPSFRFGTPEELKELIDTAHGMGISVIMDIVHSHAVKNTAEGLNLLDGTDHLYFHSGSRGNHEHWDSKLFDYGKWEVKRFLLSNVRYWLEEFHFDGYRFDGVTSMLYYHHGFTTFDHYDKYFKGDVDWDAVIYLQLANKLIHDFRAEAISIAEDVSGMPGLTRTQEEGGVGFDYRLGMGIPDYWIKLLKEKSDEDWDIHEMWHILTNRRYKEKTIGYAESHDQALVGDKTLAFWLMDKEMYFHMMIGDENFIIDRGIALHKMLRFFTLTLGGEGYLNFIGNEFGHPEWLDFPREGNGWSYKYARRQWSLVDDSRLKYQFLSNFDKAMLNFVKDQHILKALPAQQLNMDDTNKVIIFERNNLIFVFNFSVSNSIFGYKFRVPKPGTYRIVLNSDDKNFGGFGRVDNSVDHFTDEFRYLSIYLTNRTVLVLRHVE
ncbi:MAG: alpha amylase C-terminal domain-containing protein [Cytophagaceae bacterium]|nr:alpha amylase C-terminal domain-containing protein [Cytophagaceae bacterium]